MIYSSRWSKSQYSTISNSKRIRPNALNDVIKRESSTRIASGMALCDQFETHITLS